MNNPTPPLILFIIVILFDVIGLVVDGVRAAMNLLTFTDFSDKWPIIGILIVAWQLLGAIAVATHLFVWPR